MEPIGTASAQGIELDALKQATAIGEIAVSGVVKEIGFNDLDLERNGESIAQTSRAAADQHLASLDHLPHGQGLQPEDVELSVGVAGGGPLRPEPVNRLVEPGVTRRSARNDAAADDVVDQYGNSLRRVRIVAGEIAHAVPQQSAGGGNLGIS